ncbi:MAG: MBL fold metallo-hydrolase, partial [Thermodesulfobacteriota bacterium]|nr:MBL fold metallo-hydrolase [Thermodesulfobacteriota bacterium]
MRVTEEIYQVGGQGRTSPEDAAVYLMKVGNHAALIDAGCGYAHDRLLQNIRLCGVKPEQIQYLLITHCHFDHTGGVKGLQEELQCETIAHELDAPFLEQGDDEVTAATWYGSSIQSFTVDRKLSGARQEIDLGGRVIEAIHTPGHSPGSVVYLTESEGQRVLFAQDVHGPLHVSLLSDETDYIQSLRLILSLEADILCEGHFGIYRGKEE